MATATAPKAKSKVEAVTAAADLLKQMHDSAETVLQAAETIIENVDSERHIFDATELMILRNAGYDVSTSEARRELISRGLRVREFKRQFGSTKKYNAAKDAADKAAAARRVQFNKLMDELNRIQTELLDVATVDEHGKYIPEPTDEEKSVATMERARQSLREKYNLPPWVWKRFEDEITSSGNELRARVSDLKSELDRIERVVTADLHSRDGQEFVLNYARARSSNRFGIQTDWEGTPQQVVIVPRGCEWLRHVDELIDRREQIQDELFDLEDRLAASCKGAESHLNYHIEACDR
jgi:hypothetical protein